MPLEKERKVFESNIEAWREKHMGEFVLIKNDETVGFYASLADASKKGFELFGLEDFFIKQIQPKDTVNVSLMGRSVRKIA